MASRVKSKSDPPAMVHKGQGPSTYLSCEAETLQKLMPSSMMAATTTTTATKAALGAPALALAALAALAALVLRRRQVARATITSAHVQPYENRNEFDVLRHQATRRSTNPPSKMVVVT